MESVGRGNKLVVKNLPANARAGGATGAPGSIPGSARSPGAGNGNPLQDSCLKNHIDRGTWETNSPWGHKESDMTEHAYKNFKINGLVDTYKKFFLLVHNPPIFVFFFTELRPDSFYSCLGPTPYRRRLCRDLFYPTSPTRSSASQSKTHSMTHSRCLDTISLA